MQRFRYKFYRYDALTFTYKEAVGKGFACVTLENPRGPVIDDNSRRFARFWARHVPYRFLGGHEI